MVILSCWCCSGFVDDQNPLIVHPVLNPIHQDEIIWLGALVGGLEDVLIAIVLFITALGFLVPRHCDLLFKCTAYRDFNMYFLQ